MTGERDPVPSAGDWRDSARKLRLECKLAEAVDACHRALNLEPSNGRNWSELAHALRLQGRLEEARQAATTAIENAPDLASAWFNLGAVLEAQQELARALDAYRKALELDPALAEAWSNLGGLLGAQGKGSEEIDAYRRAIEINPQLAPVWSNLGDALREAGSLEEALEASKRAIELDPVFATGWNNLGSALHDSGRYDEAIEACRSALQLAPGLAEAWNNLGGALCATGRYDEAIRAHQHAIEAQPGGGPLHFNFGVTLQHCGRTDEAIARFRRALEIHPDHADAHTELSLALLGSGQLPEGWGQYEWRWRVPKARAKRYEFAMWDGNASKPCRLLLWAEQGIGDQIIYGSMVSDLVSSPMSITLEVNPRLVPLYQRSFPRLAVIPRRVPHAASPADYDRQAPLASLGRWLRPSFEAFPRHSGYLKADAARVNAIAARLRPSGAGKVAGVSWRSTNREFGAQKSTGLADWARILRVPGIRFVDLQYGDTGTARKELREQHGLDIEHLDDVDVYNDLEGLAALCAACDLVITVSNVTAHMAGALGRPVWLLAPLAKGKIWYWFSGRDDSPWYPSMRIFRQQTPGNWGQVLESVEKELAGLAKRGG